MYHAPDPLERPPMAWPAHLLGLLSVGFLLWSLLLPWTVPVTIRGSRLATPILGYHLPAGRVLIGMIGVCILVWIALHARPQRPGLRWLLQAGPLVLFIGITVWGIAWNSDHAGHASPGLLWGCLLGVSALSLAGWAPLVVTRHDLLPFQAEQQRAIHAWTLVALLVAGLLIFSLSVLVAHMLRQPVVFLMRACACSYWPP